MLVAPVRRRTLIVRLRRLAMTLGPMWVRIWDRSSSKVTSLTSEAAGGRLRAGSVR